MGLFSNKKTQADGFSFAVDEVYALKEGKTYLPVINASNEVLVEKFLKDQIGFYDIPYYIEKSLDAHNSIINPKLDDILEVDRWARSYINDLLK